jgi:hypothetical protein
VAQVMDLLLAREVPSGPVYDADRIPEFADKPLKQRFALSPWGLSLIEVKAG